MLYFNISPFCFTSRSFHRPRAGTSTPRIKGRSLTKYFNSRLKRERNLSTIFAENVIYTHPHRYYSLLVVSHKKTALYFLATSGQCFLTLTIRMKSISNSLIKIGTKFVNIIDSGTLYVIYSKWMSVRQVSGHIFQRPNSPQTKW